MKSVGKKAKGNAFYKFSDAITRTAGRPVAFLIALSLVILWGASGFFLGFSDSWQLIINTTTTVVTFLMVFIIQQSQNRDTMAIQLKLNELIASEKKASNRLIDIEDLSSEELEVLKKFYIRLSELSQKERNLQSSHSIEEALAVHKSKAK
jgi:low affinity Fe/Cu permease